MDQAIFSDDLIQSAYFLKNFVDTALQQKNRGTLVKSFYGKVFQIASAELFSNLFFDEKKRYFIYNGCNAIPNYLSLMLPKMGSPTLTLRNLKVFADNLIENFTNPGGKHIDKDVLVKIMEYLDDEYDFSKKVFKDGAASFIILNSSHRVYNSECVIFGSENVIIPHFFLYCMTEDNKNIPPEAVLFHELGHAIHTRITGNIDVFPEAVLKLLEETCFPDIVTLSSYKKGEIIADVLSVGLMYDSPFAEFDYLDYIHPDDKKLFSYMVKVILENMSYQNLDLNDKMSLSE